MELRKGEDNFLNGYSKRKAKYERVQHPQANCGKISIPKIRTISSPSRRQVRMAFIERQNLNPVTANLYSCLTRKCSDSQEKHLKEENEKEKNRSCISEYFDFLSDTEREPSHLLSRNLSSSKCAHQNISSASQHIPAKTKGKHLESVPGDCHFLKKESDRTFFQQMSSSEIKTTYNEQAEYNDIFHCTLSETNMLPQSDLKANTFCSPTHQGIRQQPHVCQRDPEPNKDPLYQDVTHDKYSLRNLFSSVSYFYKERPLPTFQNVIQQAKNLCSVQAESIRRFPSFPLIKDLQLTKYFQLPESNKKQTDSTVLDPPKRKVKLYSNGQSNMEFTEVEQSVIYKISLMSDSQHLCNHRAGLESAHLFPNSFLKTPDKLLKLRNHLANDLFSDLLGVHTEKNDFKGIYWVFIAIKAHFEPQLACLLVFTSKLYFVSLSDAEPVISITVPLMSLQELHIGFGGQTVNLVGFFEDAPVTILTFESQYTLQLCRDLAKLLMTESGYAKAISHPLLSKDLMELSTDWNAELSDLVSSNGFKVTSNFRNELADTVYLLHENTNGTKLPLGEMHLLLYTAVMIEQMHGQCVYRSLALTNTSIALLHEAVFYPHLSVTGPLSPLFDQIKMHSLGDVKCILLTDQDDLTKMTIVFSRKDMEFNNQIDTSELLTIISQSDLKNDLSKVTDVWKVTLSSYKHALFLLKYLL